MAVEARRGCGYRKVGGLYLESDPKEFWTVCDRLPYELKTCPTCGAGLKHSRTPQPINPLKLFGKHDDEVDIAGVIGEVTGHGSGKVCHDLIRPCKMCDPTEDLAFVIWIGNQFYTPQEYITEAMTMGVSRRMKTIPKGFEAGKTICYFAHVHAIETEAADPKERYKPAIFCVTRPRRIVQLVWESELTDEKRQELEKRGITPKAIPDGDKDHAPRTGVKELVTA